VSYCANMNKYSFKRTLLWSVWNIMCSIYVRVISHDQYITSHHLFTRVYIDVILHPTTVYMYNCTWPIFRIDVIDYQLLVGLYIFRRDFVLFFICIIYYVYLCLTINFANRIFLKGSSLLAFRTVHQRWEVFCDSAGGSTLIELSSLVKNYQLSWCLGALACILGL